VTTSNRNASAHQTPQAIRDETFRRRMRGLDPEEVYDFLDLLADQVQATERELSQSRAENERLRAELQRVQTELDEYEHVGDRVNDQVVQLFSQAQLVAEEARYRRAVLT
jgi:DivIVA domain-containing protein